MLPYPGGRVLHWNGVNISSISSRAPAAPSTCILRGPGADDVRNGRTVKNKCAKNAARPVPTVAAVTLERQKLRLLLGLIKASLGNKKA
jgi:hypothetical protein